jgi:uncharacterized protein (DUF2141 family)
MNRLLAGTFVIVSTMAAGDGGRGQAGGAGGASLGYVVSGEIRFREHGAIRLELCIASQFDDKGPATVERIIAIGEEERRLKRVRFRLENVAPRTYCLRAFQDTNGNGKLDEGTFGPKEPWGFWRPSRPFMRGPRFDEVAFRLGSDLDRVVIELDD